MRNRFQPKSLTLAFVLVIAVSACSPIVRNHGYLPPSEDLEMLTVGVDTRDTVAQAVGRPSSQGILDAGGWYYVRSRFETRGFLAPQEVDRQVVAISFDTAGVVSNIERFGIEDGQVVPISRRVTDSNIEGVSFLRQLLGNFGRFTADQFLE